MLSRFAGCLCAAAVAAFINAPNATLAQEKTFELKLSTVFFGVLPFVVTDILRLAILIAFPILATWLPSHM